MAWKKLDKGGIVDFHGFLLGSSYEFDIFSQLELLNRL